jgi:hypothetical protein
LDIYKNSDKDNSLDVDLNEILYLLNKTGKDDYICNNYGVNIVSCSDNGISLPFIKDMEIHYFPQPLNLVLEK